MNLYFFSSLPHYLITSLLFCLSLPNTTPSFPRDPLFPLQVAVEYRQPSFLPGKTSFAFLTIDAVLYFNS
jgi:hypothetical protein